MENRACVRRFVSWTREGKRFRSSSRTRSKSFALFVLKIKRKKTTTERGKGWVHIFWKMSSYARGECAQPLHKRIGADDVTSENRATNTVTVFLIEKITKRKKEKKKKELVPGIT